MATRPTDIPASTRHRREAETPQQPLPSRGGPGAALDPRLVAELDGPSWEQTWELTPSIHTTAFDAGARQRLWTFGEMIRPFAFDAFVISEAPRALDLHCGEGWIAQRLLDWGAHHVVAVDDRPDRLGRARLLRDHYAIREADLALVDKRDWDPPDRDDRFDVVVLHGMTDRAGEEPVLSRARAATRSICAIECCGSETNAVAEAALASGFSSVDRVRPPLQGAPVYVVEERDVLVAKVAVGG